MRMKSTHSQKLVKNEDFLRDAEKKMKELIKMKLTKKELLDIVKEEITKSVTELTKTVMGSLLLQNGLIRMIMIQKVGDSLEEQVPKKGYGS